MPNTCELHAGTVNVDEPKVLTGSGQNRHAVGCSLDAWECTDWAYLEKTDTNSGGFDVF